MFHSHRRHHSAPNNAFMGSSGGRFTPRELAVDAATFAGAEALLHRYENRHHQGHHHIRDAALAGAATYGVQKLQNHYDQQQNTMMAPSYGQQYQYQQPYAAQSPYGYYGGYGSNPYQGYGGGGGYNVYNGYNTYNMYGGDMYQQPYMPYQQHYHRRHFGGGLFGGGGAPYNGAFPPRYTIMPPGQMNWGMQPYF